MTILKDVIPELWNAAYEVFVEFLVFSIGVSNAMYVVFAGWAAIVLASVVSVLAATMTPFIGIPHLKVALRRTWTFVGLLFLLGGVANLVAVLAFRDVYYKPGDPVVDFFPFLPMLPYDISWGGGPAGGATETSILVGWFVIAVPVWWAAARLLNLLIPRTA